MLELGSQTNNISISIVWVNNMAYYVLGKIKKESRNRRELES